MPLSINAYVPKLLFFQNLGIIGNAPVNPQAVISGNFKEPVEALAWKRFFVFPTHLRGSQATWELLRLLGGKMSFA
jgi:hypothetical protein